MTNPALIQETRAVIRDELPQRPRKGIVTVRGPGGRNATVRLLTTGQTLNVLIPVGMGAFSVGDTVYLMYFDGDVVGYPVSGGSNKLGDLDDVSVATSPAAGTILSWDDGDDQAWEEAVHVATEEIAISASSFSGSSYTWIQNRTLAVPANALVVALFQGRWESNTVGDTIELTIKLDSGTQFKTDRKVAAANYPAPVSTHGAWSTTSGSHTVTVEAKVLGSGTGTIYDRRLSVFTVPIPVLG